MPTPHRQYLGVLVGDDPIGDLCRDAHAAPFAIYASTSDSGIRSHAMRQIDAVPDVRRRSTP